MTQPLVCHFLIGLPASGKSTLARKLQQIIPDAAVVSTDTARKELYGKEEIQGDWNEVESKVLEQIKNAIASNKPVIYDATNVRRDWRMGMLMKIEEKLKEIDAPQVYWVAWHLQTPVDVCKEWNQKRDRRVPNKVIEEYAELLKTRITKDFKINDKGKV
ncbi:MAG: ATP-binding protein, partial [Bacteroidota bacterium]